MKILIFGLPGSGKSTLAEPFANIIDAVYINADEVRQLYDDWDFSPKGRIRQALRMKHLSDGAIRAGKNCVSDFVCPTKETRLAFDADFTVWMDTIKESKFKDTNKIFEDPVECDYHVKEWFTNTPEILSKVIQRYSLLKQGKGYNLGADYV